MSRVDSETLLRLLSGEFLMLRQSAIGFRIDVLPEVAFAVVAMLQLALRHPNAGDGPSADLVREFIEYIKGKFSALPAISEAIRRGDVPEFDTLGEQTPIQ